MSRIRIQLEKLPARIKLRRWPTISTLLIILGACLVSLAYAGH